VTGCNDQTNSTNSSTLMKCFSPEFYTKVVITTNSITTNDCHICPYPL